MNRILVVLTIISCVGSFALGQSDAHKSELFTSYVGRTALPAQVTIPAQTCAAIINQADRIVAADHLKNMEKGDLRTASLNLRACATSELSRTDRDLAIGLYGEIVSEVERRERAGK